MSDSIKHTACKSAALLACDKGTHSLNNIGACIGYKNKILSVGWNQGDRTRVSGTLSHTSTLDTTEACKDCASVHAEVNAWMNLPKCWKVKSKGARSTKMGVQASYREKGGSGKVSKEQVISSRRNTFHLHRSQDYTQQGESEYAL